MVTFTELIQPIGSELNKRMYANYLTDTLHSLPG